ncbi:MAG: antibiotic biosynthesis monooxygenase [Chloroflexi bacterium]|nr:antibiotic biosynthesis monooxygenase [Chloroflexota bacterium]
MTQSTGPVLLVTAWHMPTMRAALRHFWRVRALERTSCRQAPGCTRVHRWVSRRSILLTSWWSDRASAERWLASDAVQTVDAAARGVRGASMTVELRDANDA